MAKVTEPPAPRSPVPSSPFLCGVCRPFLVLLSLSHPPQASCKELAQDGQHAGGGNVLSSSDP